MTIVCVTGMHRSGTSLLARVVNLLGVDLGPERHLLPPTEDNPDGYWEDNRFVQLDDQLLGFLGGWWHEPPVLEPDWEYEWRLEPFRVWGAQLVAARADDAGPTGIKDPRLSLLLPFWRTVVDVDRTVLGVRDPREVIQSLARRDALAPSSSAYLWLRYTAAAIVNDPEAVAVRYDDCFTDLDTVVDTVGAHLGLTATNAQRAAIAAFCSPSLRRSRAFDGADDTGLVGRADALFAALRTGPVGALVDTAAAELADIERARSTA
jgi:hypothetical protein